MEVFGKGTVEGTRPLLPPGECWICEHAPTQEAERVIDTRRNSRAGGTMSHLSNRKYVCESCVRELARALNFPSPELYEETLKLLDKARNEAAQFEDELAEARSSQTRVVPATDVEKFLADMKTELEAIRLPAPTKSTSAAKKAATDA